MGTFRALIAVLAGALVIPSSATALALQPIGDFASPTYVTSEPGDPDRLFIVEQDGRIRMVADGGAPTTFLDIDSIVRSPGEPGGNEEGLLSMAFSPDYATSRVFYVYYTGLDGDNYIAEYDSSGGPGTIEGTRREVLHIPHPGQTNHNGGQLQFGPDGYLYAATGDGGGGNDPGDNAQDLADLRGKMLRVDPEGDGDGDYTVPADNPFAAAPGCGPPPDGCDEIWSYGLRNPWRFSFDRATGALAIGDVGQGTWEEVDYRPAPNAGRRINFGWDCREGAHDAASANDPHCLEDPVVPFTDPVFEYQQTGTPTPCAVTGGYVVRDPSLGAVVGRYLYADFCVGELRSLDPSLPLGASDDRSEDLSAPLITSFGEDACGRVYVVSRTGPVYRLVNGPPLECASAPPAPPPGDDSDATAPTLKLSTKRRHDLGRSRKLKVRVRADEAARVELDADARPDRRDRFTFRDKAVELAAGEVERVKWRLSRREARRARKRLRRGRKVAVRVEARAIDAAGNVGERQSARIRLVR